MKATDRHLGMGGHQSHAMLKDEWLTPPHVLDALGPFDLDPCAPIDRPWDMAEHHYTIEDNGLTRPWFGRVWCNPPYGREIDHWLARCAEHGNALALSFARTETETFFRRVWEAADAVIFLRGRLHFHHLSGERAAANSGAPSVLIAYGKNNAESLRDCELAGHFVALRGEEAS